MNYIPELCPFKNYEKKKGIMLIIHSNPNPWLFLFTAEGLDWNMQYYKQISLNVLKELLDLTQYSRNTTFGEILNNHSFVKKLIEQETICSWDITEEQAALLKELYENGLSETENMHFGLDGHSYELRLLVKDAKYECWQVLPKEWELLGKLIDECLINAKLDANQEKYGYVIK